jgi:peptidoglycan/xylan/chitin deacetylase (PgdA/CDA1 family)
MSQTPEPNLPLRTRARNLALKAASRLRLHELALSLQRGRANSRIVVVEMHETPDAVELRQQIEWVAEHFTIITPELFARALETRTGTWPGSKPAVLFTFDDGRESNYLVAAPLLESFNARGIFFVVTEFIGLQGDAAKDYYYSKIDIRKTQRTTANRGESQPADAEDEIWMPMRPSQLADLVRRGHWVGSHTLSHARLAGISPADLQREIRDSADQIALWTGNPAEAFAWPYSWNSIDRASWQAVQQSHCFCFSPCPGTVDLANDSSLLIWRKEIESRYSPAEYRFMYSGLVDLLWAKRRRALGRMLA